MNQIKTFNTGRPYTKQGQRIAFIEISRTQDFGLWTAEVAFVDVDRMIDGVYHLAMISESEQVRPHMLLAAYDSTAQRYSIDQATYDKLAQAAKSI